MNTAERSRAINNGVLMMPLGWQVPSQMLYEFCNVPEAPVLSLPNITIKRGGVRYVWDGREHRPRWTARSRWGRRIKRLLFGVEWADTPPKVLTDIQLRWPIAFVFSVAD